MSSLKDLKDRIGSVKNTQKITSAMKMVAAAKLRKAQERALQSRDYNARMNAILANLANNYKSDKRNLLTGSIGKEKTRLIICATADRGLCGGFNSSVVKGTVSLLRKLEKQGIKAKILCIGSKGHDVLKREYANKIVKTYPGITRNLIEYKDAKDCAEYIIKQFEKGDIDGCSLIYNKFVTVMTQEVTEQSLIPLEINTSVASKGKSKVANDNSLSATYEFEPSEEEILEQLLPKNLAIQIFGGLLENSASEHGARMTAMDNATRNAGEMIKKLTLVYNRSRQAAITKELIEIISGAEAV